MTNSKRTYKIYTISSTGTDYFDSRYKLDDKFSKGLITRIR